MKTKGKVSKEKTIRKHTQILSRFVQRISLRHPNLKPYQGVAKATQQAKKPQASICRKLL